MNRHSRQNQVTGRSLLLKWLRHFRPWSQALRQRIRHIRQRKSRTPRHNERALTKQRLGLMPLRNLGKRIHPDQQKQPVTVLE